MKTIAFDIDDVLAANAEGFVAFSNERWGTTLTVDDYDEHWAKVWNIDIDELQRRSDAFHESGVITRYAHNEAAPPVLQNLAKNYRLVIVTSRRRSMEADTIAWLAAKYGSLFSEVYFAGIWDTITHDSHTKTKADVCQRLGVDYLVDDQLKHCVAAAQCGTKAVLFGDYSWNQTDALPNGVKRCHDWPAVQEYFRHHG